jgi:GntR family transcriptional regulator, sialic acid-inducible nan operon repressor
MVFRVVRRRKIHEEVADQIEAAIATGHFEIGDQLPSERDLMDRFGVGRPAIREALLNLERMGLVHLSPGERARVTKPTIHGLVEQLSGAARHFMATPQGEAAFKDARRVFESGIAYNAALIATDEEIGVLEKALEANRLALGNMAEFEKTDIRFHVELTKIGGNPIFLALHTALVDWLSLQRFISLKLPGVAEEAFESHKAIFNAVSAHDASSAWTAMDEHLRQVFRNLDHARIQGVA